MAFVHEKQKILGHIVKEGVGGTAGGSARQHAGVIFNTAAIAYLPYLLHIKKGALSYALSFYQLPLGFKKLHPLKHLVVYLRKRLFALFLVGHVVGGGVNSRVVKPCGQLTRYGIHGSKSVHLVTEKFYPQGFVAAVSGQYLHHVTPHAEIVALKAYIASGILQSHKALYQVVAAELHIGAQGNDLLLVFLGVTQGENAGHAGHDNNVPPFKKGAGGAVAQFVYLVVYGSVLLDINVLAGHVRFRLIIIVVGNEVFNCIVREEFPKFRAKLCGKGLVMCKHQSGSVYIGYDVSHSKGLTTTRNTQ